MTIIASNLENGSRMAAQGADNLTKAAANGKIEVVRNILSSGVHPDSVNKYGRTALQTMNYHYQEIAKLLLQNGANPNVQDPHVGRTVLHDAVQYGNEETVLCLLQGGVDAMIVDKFGDTPAHIAAREGRTKMIKILENCLSFRMRNNDGKTAYDVAMENGHRDIAESITSFQQTQGLMSRCRITIRMAVGQDGLARLPVLTPLISQTLVRYLTLEDIEISHGS